MTPSSPLTFHISRTLCLGLVSVLYPLVGSFVLPLDTLEEIDAYVKSMMTACITWFWCSLMMWLTPKRDVPTDEAAFDRLVYVTTGVSMVLACVSVFALQDPKHVTAVSMIMMALMTPMMTLSMHEFERVDTPTLNKSHQKPLLSPLAVDVEKAEEEEEESNSNRTRTAILILTTAASVYGCARVGAYDMALCCMYITTHALFYSLHPVIVTLAFLVPAAMMQAPVGVCVMILIFPFDDVVFRV